jgi:anti-sigma regulatory factor (Ser/Thr protein kinase)
VDALLSEAWLVGLDALPTIDDASTSVARELVRARGAAIGLGAATVERLAIAASELATNQLRHGRRGQLAVCAVERGGIPGLEIVAADMGRGITDPRLALAGPGPSASSLGAGLSGTRRLVDEMDLDVRWGQGTLVRARAFAEPVPRRREVGVLGRHFHEEAESGDHAVFLRAGDVLICAVVDGIGHGPLAFDASVRAGGVALAAHGSSPAGVLAACDAALAGTRGAVMAVDRIDESLGTVEHGAVGNVTVRLESYRETRTLAGSPSTLGRRGQRARTALETASIRADQALVVFTDGLASRTTLADEPDLFREHPIVAAAHLLATFGRENDDALVLVAR